MTDIGVAKTLADEVREALGLSLSRVVSLLAPIALAAWHLATFGTEGRLWPSATPLTWVASAAQWAGWSAEWALRLHSWLGARSDMYLELLFVAGVLTALSNLKQSPSAIIGLAGIAYLFAIEINNTPVTLLYYLMASGAFAVIAIMADWKADSDDRSRYMSLPSTSMIRWGVAVAGVAFGAVVFPILIFVSSIEAYRVEAPPKPPTGPTKLPVRFHHLPPTTEEKGSNSTEAAS